MPIEHIAGYVRDVVRAPDGTILLDSGWGKNVVTDAGRTLLSAFLHGAPTTVASIVALRVGQGDPAWDATGTPPPAASTTHLVDANPYDHPAASLQFDYVNPADDTVSGVPTTKLQVKASLGPHQPGWPDVNHVTSTLREYGLVGRLNGADVLINYRTHAAIAKDPTSTLERTIWLVF